MPWRRLAPPMLLLPMMAIGSPAAYALAQDDSMLDWLHASAADRSRVLDELQATGSKLHGANRAKVMDCMNRAAEIAGHGALRIGDVADACSEPPPAPDEI